MDLERILKTILLEFKRKTKGQASCEFQQLSRGGRWRREKTMLFVSSHMCEAEAVEVASEKRTKKISKKMKRLYFLE